MTRLLFYGILSALFFSSTFILNRAMSLQGGHWVWTASLRYGYMLVLLCIWLTMTRKISVLSETIREYCRHWLFWTVSGSIGFGVFYALLSFSATCAPGWVIATAWQATIIASPLVLLLFGKKVPAKGLAFTLLIFVGIVLVTLEQASATASRETLVGLLAVLIAALAYPLGNQMVWEAKYGTNTLIPRIHAPIMDNSIARVLLMVLGSLPFWIILVLVSAPPPPSRGQLISTALVALLSGVIATTLFLHARHCAANSYELAAIDSTQATEVLFALLGEILFLQGALPGAAAACGIIAVVAGLVLYIRSQTNT